MNTATLSELVTARICHDLISPVGAVSNGMELVALAGAGEEELALISDSAAAARSLLAMFRIAFGPSAAQATVSLSEIKASSIALENGYFRVKIIGSSDISRDDFKCVLLLSLCCRSVLSSHSELEINISNRCFIKVLSEDRTFKPNTFADLSVAAMSDAVTSKTVEFALLPEALKGAGRKLDISPCDGGALFYLR